MTSDIDLFGDTPTKHAGSSPYQRYKGAVGGRQNGKIGWLTFTVSDDTFCKLVGFVQKNDDWRKKIEDAINGICGI